MLKGYTNTCNLTGIAAWMGEGQTLIIIYVGNTRPHYNNFWKLMVFPMLFWIHLVLFRNILVNYYIFYWHRTMKLCIFKGYLCKIVFISRNVMSRDVSYFVIEIKVVFNKFVDSHNDGLLSILKYSFLVFFLFFIFFMCNRQLGHNLTWC